MQTMDKDYRSESLPELEDGPKFFDDSTISKDRTEGRNQDEEGVLRSMPQKIVAFGQKPIGLESFSFGLSFGFAFGVPPDPPKRSANISFSKRSQSHPVENKSVRSEHKAHVVKPSASQTSISLTPWRHDLKLRRPAKFEPCKDGDHGSKNECGLSEGVAFEESSKVKDGPMIDSQH
jgi:hypothetical protein